MKLLWRPSAREDYERWRKSDPAIYKRINALIRAIQRSPNAGLGRPKELQDDFAGWWSRNITDKDRLVYRVRIKGRRYVLEIARCRGHYES